MRGRSVTLAALAALALLGTGCTRAPAGAPEAVNVRCPEGSDCYDPPRALGDGGTVEFVAVDFAFPEVRGAVSQGDITVILDNEANGEHNIIFEGANAGSDDVIVAGGLQTAEGVVNLFPGNYTYFCDIPGHRASGMEGSLEVFATAEQAAEASSDAPLGPEEPIEADTASDEPSDEPTEEETTAEATGTPSEEPSEQTVGAGEQLDADEVDEDTLAALDDSDDIAGALADKGFARAYRLTFASGSAELDAAGEDVLDQLEALLADDADLSLRIEGNTDSDGDDASNQALSEDRAASVVAALIDRGVEGRRLSAVGNGETKLLVEDEQDDLARRINRRVEIYVVN